MRRRSFLKLMAGAGAFGLTGSYVRLNLRDVAHSSGTVTPISSWYDVQISSTPILDGETYELRVTGDVKNEVSLTLQQIKAMPRSTLRDTIQCVSDPFFLKAEVLWEGTQLSQVLGLAEPLPGVVKVLFRSADGYTADLPIWKANEQDTLLAYMADGQELPPEHGYPLRAVVPRWWGYTYSKWITEIQVTKENVLGYWENLGYPDVARKG